ncbi:MAG: hypothetical protein UV82_C0006G0065 [Candidatus Magasanikbacteria bacterium GW2011_GWD2_43_18]|nr:MAG: hypothetical protein UV18_C0005G0021 [Candidatus Magasanikbacteria bacterium GW2011_GWC2_42_27]KKT04709.1 MAG: hypothetical protein UV82_C0006G0065 [Candidatus Magasanikbacteria bacterium GW2011_GWD2_43_18]KKT24983.1 MAG: hypothetical protein UW10_C0016G0016 [Candidatus Magasanikbacteria bacterium GW2011_GWA2_43_9]HBB38016.1 hypothetical protein [Candidatus Magasanikbacteria bacterium]HCC13233.1 hypothetical protein [Candidatus Magasanikbacteria bacterium]
MTEGIPTPDHREPRTPESELSELSFAELERSHQEIQRLAGNTFTVTENGVKNAQGEGVFIRATEGGFRLSQITPNLGEVQTYLAQNPNTALTRVCTTKEEIIVAMREMLEALGKRIIE